MKNAIFSILAVAVAVNAGKVTSTRYETEVYTVTSCLPEVTECAGKETSTIHTYTTECDETEKAHPTPYPIVTASVNGTKPAYTTSTIYETKEYTITACAPTVTNCPVGAVTTTVIASTTVCPVETGHPYPPPTEGEHIPYPPKEYEHTTPPKEEEHMPYPTPSAVETPSGPQVSIITISTCVPTHITKVITVTGEQPMPTKPVEEAPPTYPGVTTVVAPGPYGTSSPPMPTGEYSYPPKNETVPFTGSANTQRAGGLLFAVGLAIALL